MKQSRLWHEEAVLSAKRLGDLLSPMRRARARTRARTKVVEPMKGPGVSLVVRPVFASGALGGPPFAAAPGAFR
eukprot:7168458-Lingulodinium_polyedra.AAC.1